MKIKFRRKFYIFLLLFIDVLLLVGIFFVFLKTWETGIIHLDNPARSNPLPSLPPEVMGKINVSSRAFIIYDPQLRSILLSKNEKLRFAPASTAKIMTAIIVLENYDLKRVLTAKNISSVEGSKMGLIEGEQMTVGNLLYGMMLPSGNDAAHVLAENYPGGIDAFVAKMNKRAKELEMANTEFIDPAGYDDNNYTTALDLGRLAAFAMGNPTLAKIVSTKRTTVNDEEGKITHNLANLNELLGVDGVTGIKTGFTDEAGGVLVTSVNQAGRKYVIVVLNSQDRFADTKNIVERALQKIRLLFY